ncbi:MAG: serine/threonine-protein kinase [Kofleriaceae bacterium]
MTAGPVSSGPPVDSVAATELAGGDAGSLDGLLRDVASTGGVDEVALGTVLGGQYRVVRPLGRGGMGVVYEAADLRLHRTVAVKLGAHRSRAALDLLVREAGALAKLTHPNVVVVYQVGEHDGRVFLAMEHVTGGTARSWLRAQARGWRAIVALFAAAGEGLHAAHQAGFIHRDFKPDNVLVGDDDRPRVADFGLVRAILASPDEAALATGATAAAATRAGAIVGTLAYMPLEQLRGEVVDARADQFAFCASLWEALHGTRPFGGATPAEVEAALASSPPDPGDERHRIRGVPRHVLAALRRGLRPAAAERWPAMDVLVRELRRDPTAGRRRIAVGGAVAVLASAVAIAVTVRTQGHTAPCGDGAALLAPTWSPARGAALARALGPPVGARTVASLDRYAQRWTVAHRDACRATRVAGSQSAEMLDRRMQCLFALRAQFGAAVATLEAATPALRAAAADVVGGLADLTACADVAALAGQPPLPTDPTARAKVDQAEERFADAAAAATDAGQPDRVAKADHALAAARAAGWKPVIARTLLVQSEVLRGARRLREARAALEEACAIAVAAGTPSEAAVAYADLARMLADAHDDGAELALLTARAFGERAGPGVRVNVLDATAEVAIMAGRVDEGIAARRQLITLADQATEPGLTPMISRFNLAAALSNAGKFEEAQATCAEAIAWGEQHVGPAHPAVGQYRSDLAGMLLNRGKLTEAIAEAARALAILEAWYGPDDVRLADTLRHLGDAYMRSGDPASALPFLERGLACAQRGEDLRVVEDIQSQLAIYYARIGQFERAAVAAAALTDAVEARAGAEAAGLINPLLISGRVARELGRLDESERTLRRALAICAANVPADHPATLNLRNELGMTLVAAGRFADARALLEPQAHQLAGRGDVNPGLSVEAHATLASALWGLRQRAAARAAIAVAARAAAQAADRGDLTAQVEAWRAAHR